MSGYVFFFCLGSCFGSFFTVVSERLPLGQSLMKPASHCVNCKHPLSAFDLVPVLSYLYLRGRCRFCKLPYPKISFFVEILTGGFFTLLYALNLWQISFIPGYLLLLTAFLLSLTDFFYMIVEPLIFYPMTLITLLSILYFETPFNLRFWDSLVIFGLLLLLTIVYPNNLGFGDILLLSSWGLFLGGYAINLILLSASTLALTFALFRSRKNKTKAIPFVPFLSIGLAAYLIWKLTTLMS